MTVKLTMPIASTLAAVMAVTSLGMTAAIAAPPHATPPSAQNDAQVIQVASKKKHRRVHRNNAAGAAAMMGMMGAIGAIAAQDSYRDRYYDDGYYYRGGGRGYHRGGHYRGPRYHGATPGYYRHGGIPRGN